MDELEGVVGVEVTARGSKGERLSVVLKDADGPPVVLRSRRPASLSAEPDLASYDGQRVRVRGVQGWASFVVDQIEPVTDPGAAAPDGP